VPEGIDHWHNLRVLRKALLLLLRYKRPQFVNVNDRPPRCVASQVVMAHTNFSKVTRMVLVKVGPETLLMLPEQVLWMVIPVVVLTTSKTTTSGVLTVLAYASVAGRDVAAMLASLRKPSRHFLQNSVSILSSQVHLSRVQAIHRHQLRIPIQFPSKSVSTAFQTSSRW